MRSSARGSSGGMRWRPQVITGRREPFEDVQLGPLLGKGSYGRVYRAMWNGAPVAVKARPCCWRPYLPTASRCRSQLWPEKVFQMTCTACAPHAGAPTGLPLCSR